MHKKRVFFCCSITLAEIPPKLQEVKLKQHKLGGLDPKELSELTRKCHLFGSIDLSGWKGVRLLSFRSLCLAVGGSLQTVSLPSGVIGSSRIMSTSVIPYSSSLLSDVLRIRFLYNGCVFCGPYKRCGLLVGHALAPQAVWSVVRYHLW